MFAQSPGFFSGPVPSTGAGFFSGLVPSTGAGPGSLQASLEQQPSQGSATNLASTSSATQQVLSGSCVYIPSMCLLVFYSSICICAQGSIACSFLMCKVVATAQIRVVLHTENKNWRCVT